MTLYFFDSQETPDLLWTTLANWWTDAAHTVQASALPLATDNVVIESQLVSLGADRTVANATFNEGGCLDDSQSHTLNVTGVCTFNEGSSNQATAFITGNCVFNGSSHNAGGTITGNCVFNDDCYNQYGTITGNCVFNDRSYNYYVSSTITGDCVFNGNSWNLGTITGDCTFNGTSYNDGTITGNCVFNDDCYNGEQGYITGNCVFNDYSNNSGFPTGDCIFNGESSNYDIVAGNCIFNDYSHMDDAASGAVMGDCTFNDNSWFNLATILGTAFLRHRAADFARTLVEGKWRGLPVDTRIQFREMDVIGTGLN